MKADSTHTRRCFEQIRDDLFRMVLCEEDAAARAGMDTPMDYTVNTHRMRVLENVAGMLSEVGKVFVPDFDGDRFMTDTGF